MWECNASVNLNLNFQNFRLRCCGKYVTGIGNVPKWDPPHRKELLVKPETADT